MLSLSGKWLLCTHPVPAAATAFCGARMGKRTQGYQPWRNHDTGQVLWQHGWQSLALIPNPSPCLVQVTWFPRPQTCSEPLPLRAPRLDGSWDKALPIPRLHMWSHRGDSEFPCHLRWKQRCPKGTAQSPWGSVTVSIHLTTSQKKSLNVESCFWGSYSTSQHPGV